MEVTMDKKNITKKELKEKLKTELKEELLQEIKDELKKEEQIENIKNENIKNSPEPQKKHKDIKDLDEIQYNILWEGKTCGLLKRLLTNKITNKKFNK